MSRNLSGGLRLPGTLKSARDCPTDGSISQKAWMVSQTAQQPIRHQYQAVKAAGAAGDGDRSLLLRGQPWMAYGTGKGHLKRKNAQKHAKNDKKCLCLKGI